MLCPVKSGQENARRFADVVGDDVALRQLKTESGADKFDRHLEQLFGKWG